MPLEFEIEGAPSVDVLVTPGRQGEQGIPGPNLVDGATETPLSGVLVGDAGTVRAATSDEVVSASAMQAAVAAQWSAAYERTHSPGDWGTPWNDGGTLLFSEGPTYLLHDGRQILNASGGQILQPID